MKLMTPSQLATLSVLGIAAAAFSGASMAAVDADAAAASAKKSGCMKCHATDKDKAGPSFKSAAAKWKGKADAEAKLSDFLSKTTKIKTKDGTEEEHKGLDTKDANEVKNVVGWVLAQ